MDVGQKVPSSLSKPGEESAATRSESEVEVGSGVASPWQRRGERVGEEVDSVAETGVRNPVKVSEERGARDQRETTDCKEADKSSSGIEDGCESGAAFETEIPPGRNDTTDSDSLASRFEFVHYNRQVVRDSASSEDFTLVSDSTPSQRSDKDKLAQKLGRGAAAIAEDVSTDQKEEDNLSDTGHVSNSSNYNPSDSGSEAENCDDGDTVGMPVPLSPMSSSSTLENSPSSPLPSTSSLTSSPRKMAQQQQEGESSASEPGSPDARQSLNGVRRRRRTSNNQSGAEPAEGSRPRPLPPKLLGLRAQSKLTQTSGVSSSENEAGGLTPEAVNKVWRI